MNTFKKEFFICSVISIFFASLLLVVIPVGVAPGLWGIGEVVTSPSTWPNACALALLCFSVILAVDAYRKWRSSPEDKTVASAQTDWKLFLTAVGIFFLYYYSVPILGMTLASAIFAGIYAYLCGARNPIALGIVAIFIPVFLYLFFYYVARVVIPTGLLKII